MAGRVLHVCISARKGTVKRPVAHGELVADHGLAGDAHAGPTHRQISLLDAADIAELTAKGLALEPGDFGENFVVAGVNLHGAAIGTRIVIGAAELLVTQIGKECHTRCAIYDRTGDCIMPRAGVFARVLRGGPVAAGMKVALLKPDADRLPP